MRKYGRANGRETGDRYTQSGCESGAVLQPYPARINPRPYPEKSAARTPDVECHISDSIFQSRKGPHDGCSAVPQFGVTAPYGRVPRLRPSATNKTLPGKHPLSKKTPSPGAARRSKHSTTGPRHYLDGRERGERRPPTSHGVETRSPLPRTSAAREQQVSRLLHPVLHFCNVTGHDILLLFESGPGNLVKLLPVSFERLLQ